MSGNSVYLGNPNLKKANVLQNWTKERVDEYKKCITLDVFKVKVNEVENLYVEDKTEINIKTETLDMYSLRANYDKKNNIIELFNNVKIYRDNETIYGDYAKINTLDESYKVTSKKSEKVKVLLKEKDE